MDDRNYLYSTTSAEVTELSGTQLARLLGLSVPAYERRRLKDDFSRTQRTKLTRLVNVIERAKRVLGDRGRAQQWLIHPNRALGSSTPLTLLQTREGTQRVYNVLMRMEAGVFA